MQVLMPDGVRLSERFETMSELTTRREELEKKGGKVERVVRVHQGGRADPPKGNPKYPRPHQGSREIERRCRQLAAGKLKVSA